MNARRALSVCLRQMAARRQGTSSSYKQLALALLALGALSAVHAAPSVISAVVKLASDIPTIAGTKVGICASNTGVVAPADGTTLAGSIEVMAAFDIDSSSSSVGTPEAQNSVTPCKSNAAQADTLAKYGCTCAVGRQAKKLLSTALLTQWQQMLLARQSSRCVHLAGIAVMQFLCAPPFLPKVFAAAAAACVQVTSFGSWPAADGTVSPSIQVTSSQVSTTSTETKTEWCGRFCSWMGLDWTHPAGQLSFFG